MAGRREFVLFPLFVEEEMAGGVALEEFGGQPSNNSTAPVFGQQDPRDLSEKNETGNPTPPEPDAPPSPSPPYYYRTSTIPTTTTGANNILLHELMDERTSLLASGTSSRDGDHGAAQIRTGRNGRSSRFGGEFVYIRC